MKTIDLNTITKDEEIIFKLRSLYGKYGYSQFRMNKFEEYELYVNNKDFLVSSNIISFTDMNGRLMALKPDVTLSIIKNGNDETGILQKVYYNENVYRVPDKDSSFKEIMQVGVECIGDIDSYSILEVLTLAIKSLERISKDFVLDISHLSIVKEIMGEIKGLSEKNKQKVIEYFSQKNTHDLSQIEGTEKLCKLVSSYGNLEKTSLVLDELYPNGLSKSAKELKDLVGALEENGYKDKVKIDFSVLSDMNYYSGIVFKGYVKGIPSDVLSGGQYDLLMEKMGRKSKGLGFAVYLDMLEQFDDEKSQYDIDALVLYDKDADFRRVDKVVNDLLMQGKSVLARNQIPQKIKYKDLIEIKNEDE